MILVDSNVILDILTYDSVWFKWSSETLEKHANTSLLAINPIIYAEISISFERIEDLEKVLLNVPFERLTIPWEAGFLAGKCFLKYKRSGGEKKSTLPDFFIGAHAAVSGYSLLTRDKSRYATYFPSVNIIAPL